LPSERRIWVLACAAGGRLPSSECLLVKVQGK